MQGPYRTATGSPAPLFHHQTPPPTAYSYAAPQYNTTNQSSFASRSFFRAFFATMICLVVIFGVILIITWLVLRPSLPNFTLNSLSLTNFTTTTSATWQLAFLVRNGNKKIAVTYNALRSSVFYRSNHIAESRLAPFKQDTKSQTTLNATLSAANASVDQRVVDDVNGEMARGSVVFDVRVFASTSFRFGSWRFRTRVLKVLCPNVPVGISSNATSGELVGGARECQVWNGGKFDFI